MAFLLQPRRFLLILSVACLIGFALLSKYEDRLTLRTIDFAVTVKTQERIDRSSHLRLSVFADAVMGGATFFAGPVFTSVIICLITAYAVYDWKKQKIRWAAWVVPVGFICILLAELFGKSIVHHPSPPFGMIKYPTSVFPSEYINEQFSYPSGHAARAIYVAVTAGFVFWWKRVHDRTRHFLTPKRIFVGIIGLTYIALVSISRIYLGHHWFSDVLGGVLLGGGMGLFSSYVFLRY